MSSLTTYSIFFRSGGLKKEGEPIAHEAVCLPYTTIVISAKSKELH